MVVDMANLAAVAGRPRRMKLAGLVTLSALALSLSVTGCASSGSSRSGSTSPSGLTSASSATSASPSTAAPVIKVAAEQDTVSFLDPVKLVVSGGSFDSVEVKAAGSDQLLQGEVSADGVSWISSTPPKPAANYQVAASVKDSAGQSRSAQVAFTVDPVPSDQRISFSVTPDDGTTVGIAQPIVVRFRNSVTEKAAVEKVLRVKATTPSGTAIGGSWHWLNSKEVHWRPHLFWTPGTKVSLEMRIAGVKAATDRYGRKDYSQTFTIGASQVTKVDGITHRATVYRNGKLLDTWPTGTGKSGLETYSGTYVVLGKSPVVQMDSCSARITCDKKDPDYYDEKEYWATRLTASGTFVHAASWDGLLGRANVSHGCIHLSDSDAKTFYDHAVPGDVVIVSRTGRGPQQRIDTQDPGLYDWNLSWSAWTAGSALH
jgi:lipoprotein-anchoring transpeptidase ErfK/SrfK